MKAFAPLVIICPGINPLSKDVKMSSLTIKIEKLSPEVKTPEYGTPGSGCFDIFALNCIAARVCDGDYPVDGLTSLTISTGLKFDIPEGWVMRLYSRSGHGFKHDVRLCNSTGVIDSDYTGEVMVKLSADTAHGCAFLSELSLKIAAGEKVAICQGELAPVYFIDFSCEVVDKETGRGANGFGSTDKAGS